MIETFVRGLSSQRDVVSYGNLVHMGIGWFRVKWWV